MIIDSFNRVELYAPLLKNLDKGLEALRALKKLEPGRYEFEGGFFMIQEGTTIGLDENNFESHRKYLDLQAIVEGSEDVCWQDIKDLEPITEYDPERDARFYKGPDTNCITISEGMFYVANPHDGHKPCVHKDHAPTHYKKIVMKLPASFESFK
jgi:YhcH/YjgK/YiaL family protein